MSSICTLTGAEKFSKSLVKLLMDSPPNVASADEVHALIGRLNGAKQTEDRDHMILAHLLNISLVIYCGHDLSSYEVVADLGPESKTVALRIMERPDGAGVRQGHFDLLMPAFRPSAEKVTADADPEASWQSLQFSHAITLRDPMLAQAILDGYKDCENRTCGLSNQWVCLHIAKTRMNRAERESLLHILPHSIITNLPKGHIVGMVFIEGCQTIKEYRSSVGCGSLCKEHHSSECIASPFASGPVVNFVKHRILFHETFQASGALGKWPLPLAIKKKIQELLASGKCTWESNDGVPRPWPLPWLEPGHTRLPNEARFGPTCHTQFTCL